MQTIKIEIPPGFEIDAFDTQSGVVKFKPLKPKDVMERIKTVDDILADNHITRQFFNQWSDGLSKDEVAYRILKMLATSLNEGWVPDWKNSNEYKYYPWFEMNGSSGFRVYVCARWSSASRVGSRLCYKTRALAEYAGSQFTDVYKQFLTLQ